MQSIIRALLTAALIAGPPVVSGAVDVALDYGDGGYDFRYGSSPVDSTLRAFYFFEGGAGPAADIGLTGMQYTPSASGDGTGFLQASYRVENTTSDPFANLKFFADVDPNGDDTFIDIPGISTPAPSAFEIRNFAVDDLAGVFLADDILSGASLDNTDACGAAPCDVEFGLQVDIPLLSPGQIWTVIVGLSDDGQTLTDRFLTATTNPTLHFSVTSSVVPLPAPIFLLAGALGLIGVLKRYRPRS